MPTNGPATTGTGTRGWRAARTQFHDVEDIFDMFGGIFGDLFGGGGGGRRGRRAHRGHDIRCDVTLDLEEAARGVPKTVEFERSEPARSATGRVPLPAPPAKRVDGAVDMGRSCRPPAFSACRPPVPRAAARARSSHVPARNAAARISGRPGQT